MRLSVKGKTTVTVLEDSTKGSPRLYIPLLTNRNLTRMPQYHRIPVWLLRFHRHGIPIRKAAANDISKDISLMEISGDINWIFGSIKPV